MARTRIYRYCLQCHNGFSAPAAEVKRGRGKFCSRACFYRWHRGANHPQYNSGMITKSCIWCQEKFVVKQSQNQQRFCSKKCYGAWRTATGASRKQVALTCYGCGKHFEIRPSKAKGRWKRKYCSRKCASAARAGEHCYRWKGGPVALICEECGKKFTTSRAKANDKQTGKYCSIECRALANTGMNSALWKERITLTCYQCGKEFSVLPSRAERETPQKYCSRECFVLADSGAGSHLWKGGSQDWHKYGSGWQTLAGEIRQRDRFTCQLCDMTQEECGTKLSVHHIVPLRLFGSDLEQAHAPENLVALCDLCHKKVEIDWCKYRVQFLSNDSILSKIV